MILGSILRNRLVHFVAIGAALAFVAPKEHDASTIVLDGARADRALRDEQARRGRELTSDEADRVVENVIDDEVLAREATRLGIGTQDDVVRARLAERMRATFRNALPEPVIEPGELAEESARIAAAAPKRVRLALWFVARDRPGAASSAEALAREVAKSGVEGARGRGDPTPLPNGALWTEEELARAAGTSVARAAMTEELGRPTAPIASAWGFYVLVPLERRDARPDEVRAAAYASLREKKLAPELARLVARARSSYVVDAKRAPAGASGNERID